MHIFDFIVLSAIIAHPSVFTPHISKTYFSSLNVRELELNWCSKDQSRKMGKMSLNEIKWAQKSLNEPKSI